MKKEIMTIGVANKNNRIYSREVMERAVKEAQDKVRKNRMLVHYDNQISAVSDFTTAGGVVKELKIEGDKVIADVEILKTPTGNKLKEDFEKGHVQVRAAGIGGLNKQENGTYLVTEDYVLDRLLFTYDGA